jgi:hypothetical protein
LRAGGHTQSQDNRRENPFKREKNKPGNWETMLYNGQKTKTGKQEQYNRNLKKKQPIIILISPSTPSIKISPATVW